MPGNARPIIPGCASIPEWFRHRPDGTIKYAENPPKKYQDIYPLDFECDDWRELWQALLDVTLFWIDRGVRIFRVDNPHTKSFGFWEWLIERGARPRPARDLPGRGVHAAGGDAVPGEGRVHAVLHLLHLAQHEGGARGLLHRADAPTEMREYFRPNLFANTPDILHAYLQHGGRPAFEARLLLAATLGASYGIYSGFELCESRAVPRHRGICRLGEVPVPGVGLESSRAHRRARHAGQPDPPRASSLAVRTDSLRFHATDNPQIIAYCKIARPIALDAVFVVVNLDPLHMQHGLVQVPGRSVAARTVDAQPGTPSTICSTDTHYSWRGDWNYVRFDPGVRQAHIL